MAEFPEVYPPDPPNEEQPAPPPKHSETNGTNKEMDGAERTRWNDVTITPVDSTTIHIAMKSLFGNEQQQKEIQVLILALGKKNLAHIIQTKIPGTSEIRSIGATIIMPPDEDDDPNEAAVQIMAGRSPDPETLLPKGEMTIGAMKTIELALAKKGIPPVEERIKLRETNDPACKEWEQTLKNEPIITKVKPSNTKSLKLQQNIGFVLRSEEPTSDGDLVFVINLKLFDEQYAQYMEEPIEKKPPQSLKMAA